MTHKSGWMICRYLGTCNEQELAGAPIWNFVFPTRKAVPPSGRITCVSIVIQLVRILI